LTDAVVALAPTSGVLAATCAALGVSRATVQRRRFRLGAPVARSRPRPRPARALTGPQRQQVLDLLHAPRFADQAPAEIYASLLDEGVYHCSIRTMYRLLDSNGEIRERRRQLRHPAYRKPELLARTPNEVWSWDITKLKGPTKWSYFYLYGAPCNAGGSHVVGLPPKLADFRPAAEMPPRLLEWRTEGGRESRPGVAGRAK